MMRCASGGTPGRRVLVQDLKHAVVGAVDIPERDAYGHGSKPKARTPREDPNPHESRL